MKQLIEVPQYNPEGRRIPDSAVYWWHNTTKEEQENIRLKMQIDALIMKNESIDNLLAQLVEAKASVAPVHNEILEKIEEGVNFIKGKYTKSIRKPSNATLAKEERKQAIRLKMATRGKKS